ncbi:MAG: hypothetical protein A3F72_10435 [Bacteroidetes bacterium RIFCSPLOWO2_12_FULL_35_15]|nr:MAG: hypothetical protein A3F72_10435 [Bacteroidetes bacterium RIFCSPLOWO2_12_FULL_35_15]
MYREYGGINNKSLLVITPAVTKIEVIDFESTFLKIAGKKHLQFFFVKTIEIDFTLAHYLIAPDKECI